MNNNVKLDDCSICLNKINKNNFCILRCSHTYCAGCLFEWIDQQNTCPLCKKKIYTWHTNKDKLDKHTKVIRYKSKLIMILNANLDYLKPTTKRIWSLICTWSKYLSNKLKHTTNIITKKTIIVCFQQILSYIMFSIGIFMGLIALIFLNISIDHLLVDKFDKYIITIKIIFIFFIVFVIIFLIFGSKFYNQSNIRSHDNIPNYMSNNIPNYISNNRPNYISNDRPNYISNNRPNNRSYHRVYEQTIYVDTYGQIHEHL
jgi:hypothetical protein